MKQFFPHTVDAEIDLGDGNFYTTMYDQLWYQKLIRPCIVTYSQRGPQNFEEKPSWLHLDKQV